MHQNFRNIWPSSWHHLTPPRLSENKQEKIESKAQTIFDTLFVLQIQDESMIENCGSHLWRQVRTNTVRPFRLISSPYDYSAVNGPERLCPMFTCPQRQLARPCSYFQSNFILQMVCQKWLQLCPSFIFAYFRQPRWYIWPIFNEFWIFTIFEPINLIWRKETRITNKQSRLVRIFTYNWSKDVKIQNSFFVVRFSWKHVMNSSNNKSINSNTNIWIAHRVKHGITMKIVFITRSSKVVKNC